MGPNTTCVFEAMSVSTLLLSIPLLLSFVRIFGKIFAISGGSFAAPDIFVTRHRANLHESPNHRRSPLYNVGDSHLFAVAIKYEP